MTTPGAAPSSGRWPRPPILIPLPRPVPWPHQGCSLSPPRASPPTTSPWSCGTKWTPCACPGAAVDPLRRLDEWSPAASGVSLSPIDTLLAVATVATDAETCLEAYRFACELGGDTDTVSALAAALVAARSPQTCELFAIPWIDDVNWSEIPQAADAMNALFTLRRASQESYA